MILILARNYTDSVANSLGSLKGAPCIIKSQTETDDSYIIIFEWTGKDGNSETSKLIIKKPKDGADGDPGYTPQKGVDYFDGEKGDPGYTPQ